VPPDLTQLQKDNRYAMPDSARAWPPPRPTASGRWQRGRRAWPWCLARRLGPVSSRCDARSNARQPALAGGQARRPEQLWPQLKQFWEDSALPWRSESPTTGTMETEWAENRAKIPQDIIRRSIGKVFDSVYSTGERDKFRTRLERRAGRHRDLHQPPRRPGSADRRAEGNHHLDRVRTIRAWKRIPGAPDGQADRRRNQAGSEGKGCRTAAVASRAACAAGHAKLRRRIEVDEGFDRAWRRVGLALDRVGFTVEDRDRVQGMYFVRYVDPDAAEKDGFFSKLFSFGASDDKAKEAQRYRVLVKADRRRSVSPGERAGQRRQAEPGNRRQDPQAAERRIEVISSGTKKPAAGRFFYVGVPSRPAQACTRGASPRRQT
jgi:outer membrane protein assembly factor BamC